MPEPAPGPRLVAWEATDRRIGAAAEALATRANSPTPLQRVLRRIGRSTGRSGESGPVRFATGETPHDPVAGTGADVVAASEHRPGVSVVVPSAGASGPVDGTERCYVTALVDQLVEVLGGDDELVVVVGAELAAGASGHLTAVTGSDPRVRVVSDPAEFSFSSRVNLGVEASTAEVVVLLNDDTELLEDDWLVAMAQAALTPGVGAVGATLLHEDGTLQHAGLTTVDGLPTHAWAGWDPSDPADRDVRGMDRLAWGVTGAALAVSRSNWELLGGFSGSFPLNYNDVDFCCKAAHMGLQNVVLASVRLRHFETRSRPRELLAPEVEAIRRRWAHRLGPDPLVAGTSALQPPKGRDRVGAGG